MHRSIIIEDQELEREYTNFTDYKITRYIGKGSFSYVFEVIKDNKKYAAKFSRFRTKFDKRNYYNTGKKFLFIKDKGKCDYSFLSEVLIIKYLSKITKYAIKIIDIVHDKNYEIVGFIMPLYTCTADYQIYRATTEGFVFQEDCYDDKEVIDVCNMIKEELPKAIKEINDAGVIHGDIKPSNILIHNKSVKIIDYSNSLTMFYPMNYERKIGCTPMFAPKENDLEQYRKSTNIDSYSVNICQRAFSISEKEHTDYKTLIGSRSILQRSNIMLLMNPNPPKYENEPGMIAASPVLNKNLFEIPHITPMINNMLKVLEMPKFKVPEKRKEVHEYLLLLMKIYQIKCLDVYYYTFALLDKLYSVHIINNIEFEIKYILNYVDICFYMVMAFIDPYYFIYMDEDYFHQNEISGRHYRKIASLINYELVHFPYGTYVIHNNMGEEYTKKMMDRFKSGDYSFFCLH